MRHLLQSPDPFVLDGGVLADHGTDLELGDQLEAPARNGEVVAVTAVGVVVVEDRFDRFDGVGVASGGADVDAAIGVGGDEVDARPSKGRTTEAV